MEPKPRKLNRRDMITRTGGGILAISLLPGCAADSGRYTIWTDPNLSEAGQIAQVTTATDGQGNFNYYLIDPNKPMQTWRPFTADIDRSGAFGNFLRGIPRMENFGINHGRIRIMQPHDENVEMHQYRALPVISGTIWRVEDLQARYAEDTLPNQLLAPEHRRNIVIEANISSPNFDVNATEALRQAVNTASIVIHLETVNRRTQAHQAYGRATISYQP